MNRSAGLLLFLTACGSDSKLLSQLDGGWVGTVTALSVTIPIGGTASWDEEEKLLEGQFTLQDAAPDVPHTYAIRRSSVSGGMIYLEMTDLLDGTRGMNIEGELDGDLKGEATVRYTCPTGTCGYVGVLAMSPGAPPTLTGDTGVPPLPTGETGIVLDTAPDTGPVEDTGPLGDTGPTGDTAPPQDTAPPEDTGP